MQDFSDVAFIGIAGLNTDPLSDIWGMRPLIEGMIADRYPGASAFFTGYDVATFEWFLDIARRFKRVVIMGHSFGGACMKWLLDQASVSNPPAAQILLAVAFDPAPNSDRFHQFFPWQLAVDSDVFRWHIPLNVVQDTICFHQTNEQVCGIGVCGVPFHAAPGRVWNYNVTPWGLHHCEMVGDVRVQNVVRDHVAQLIPPQSPVQGSGLDVSSLSD